MNTTREPGLSKSREGKSAGSTPLPSVKTSINSETVLKQCVPEDATACKNPVIPLHELAKATLTPKDLLIKLSALIKEGVDINQADDLGNTALHYACINNNTLATAALLRFGEANYNLRNSYGKKAEELLPNQSVASLRDDAKALEALARITQVFGLEEVME